MTLASDQVPDSDHFARYCGGAQVKEDGSISGAAFRLRKRSERWEEYLSGNWLEFLDPHNRAKQIAAVQKVIASKLTPGATSKLAVFHVGKIRTHVLNGTSDRRNLTVTHIPERDDPSHSGIRGLKLEDDEVSDLISQTVEAVLPCKIGQ